MPVIRLNLEIRIDASVTPEQIDQINASMAKHIGRRSARKAVTPRRPRRASAFLKNLAAETDEWQLQPELV